jgi:hypothetical protein
MLHVDAFSSAPQYDLRSRHALTSAPYAAAMMSFIICPPPFSTHYFRFSFTPISTCFALPPPLLRDFICAICRHSAAVSVCY